MDRFALYERCVQSPTHLVPLLRAVHGGDPHTLAEDFCGSAALSRAWVESRDDAQAVAVDADPDVFVDVSRNPRLTLIHGDVIGATQPAAQFPADILFVGNFSIGYLHTRPDLVAYLKHAHERLHTSPERKLGGPAPDHTAPSVFICDTYAGESAFTIGHVHRNHPGPDGSQIRYTWEQREADPLTGMVLNAIHFRVSKGGMITDELHDAFVYHWRLWSVPELRDAMLEAGFTSTEVYAKVADAFDQDGNAYVEPVTDPADLDDTFIVLIAARV